MKKGKKHNKEAKRKMSAALKTNPPNKAKHWSQEVREKTRASNIGQKRSEQTRHNISLGLKKHWKQLHDNTI
jgi:hypothetical protein